MEADAEKLKIINFRIAEQVLQESNSQLHNQNRHLRYTNISMIALFVCILVALILSAFLIVYFIQAKTPCQKYRYSNSTDLGVIRFASRRGWQALPARTKRMVILEKPARCVIFMNTGDTFPCKMSEECCNLVKSYQFRDMHREDYPWQDIGWHYVIDYEGLIYEGRSLEFVPAAAKGWNYHTIGIAIIGNFKYDPYIPGSMISSFAILLDWLLKSKYLDNNYILYGFCEVRNVDRNGRYLYKYVRDHPEIFPHVRSRGNESYCGLY